MREQSDVGLKASVLALLFRGALLQNLLRYLMGYCGKRENANGRSSGAQFSEGKTESDLTLCT